MCFFFDPQSPWRAFVLQVFQVWPDFLQLSVRKCLAKMGKPRASVLLLGDSTTQGLLQEALGMWSEAAFLAFMESW